MTELNEDISKELDLLRQQDNLSLKPIKDTKGLSDDQVKALEALKEWLIRSHKSRSDDNFFALRGSAGTGKTTLIDTLLKELPSMYAKWRVCICAPTHKAKKIIVEKTRWKIAETLQKLLGLKLDIGLEDFDLNNPQFNPIGDRKIRDYELVIVDEASMVNEGLYSTLVEAAKSCGCKILFVGDTLQLNPVKEYGISPSLISPINSFTLTQIVRQEKGNPLINILAALRIDIENNTSTFMDLLRANPNNINELGEGYVLCESNEFAKHLNVALNSNEFKEDKNFCRYISWTNESITDVNRYIRNKIFNVKNQTLELDEVMLSYKGIVVDDESILTNSDDYIVEKIEESVVSTWDYPLKTLYVNLRGIDTGAVSKVHILLRDKDNYENYVSIFKQQVAKAKNNGRKGWKNFYDNFKNEVLILENIFEDNTLLVKKDIDYGYGITIHKSQGSTYNTVFVNGKDINKNRTDLERKRLWYVALSRTSRIVYINL